MNTRVSMISEVSLSSTRLKEWSDEHIKVVYVMTELYNTFVSEGFHCDISNKDQKSLLTEIYLPRAHISYYLVKPTMLDDTFQLHRSYKISTMNHLESHLVLPV